MSVGIRCAFAACPTKLVFAHRASHVVATHVFLNFGAAYRTERNVILDELVVLTPTIKLLFHGLFARVLSMPIISTFEADFCGALWTA